MKIKIRKKEEEADVEAEEIEPLIATQSPYIQPRAELHRIIKSMEYASFKPIHIKDNEEKEVVVKQPVRDVKEIERLVDELIEKKSKQV